MKTFLRKDILLNYPWRYAPPGPPSSAAVTRESSPSRTSDHRDPLPGAPPAGVVVGVFSPRIRSASKWHITDGWRALSATLLIPQYNPAGETQAPDSERVLL